jgi:hypothetical protein
MRALAVLLWLCGCGAKTAPPTPSGPPASLVASRAGTDDVIVAQVNGRPVWGSCVAAQATHGVGRDAALHQCVGFELLAQAAEARGYALDREVANATRDALVNQLIAREFEDKYKTPAELGDTWTRLYQKNRWRLEHPEVRGSAYVRVQDEGIAKEIAAALGRERGLMPPHIQDIAERVAAGRTKVEFGVVPPDIQHGRLDATYTGALFSIPEVGRTAPPVHTRWGWDIVLFESVIPAASGKPDEIAAQLLPDVKRAYFPIWVNKIAQGLGVKIEVIEKNVAALENL